MEPPLYINQGKREKQHQNQTHLPPISASSYNSKELSSEKMERPPAVPMEPFHVRSISMPSGSHPAVLRIEEELQKLRTRVAAPATIKEICNGLRGFGYLYDCIDDLFHMPSMQQASFDSNQKKWLEKKLDWSIQLLDLCGNTKDVLVTVEEFVQEILSALRRRGDTATEKKLFSCIFSDNRVKKMAKKCKLSLKQLDVKSGFVPPINKDCDLYMVAKVFKEAKETTTAFLSLVFSFLSTPISKAKIGKWFFVSKSMNRRKVACEVAQQDFSLSFFYESNSWKEVEAGLDRLFLRLICTRVSLLNILSI